MWRPSFSSRKASPFAKANPRRGELCLTINGKEHLLKMNLTALAILESNYDGRDILHLTQQFSKQGMTASDVHHVLAAALSAGGAEVPDNMDIAGGYAAASTAAARLLEMAFAA